MNIIPKAAFIAGAFFILVSPVIAEEKAPVQVSHMNVDPAAAKEQAIRIQTLALKRLEFELFAKSKVQQLNRNHIFSRSRMEITKQLDGTYLARYHQIDGSKMGIKVRRSESGAIPYVGILSYQERVFESTAKTLEQLDQSTFTVVKIIPNRHIFSYQKGIWK